MTSASASVFVTPLPLPPLLAPPPLPLLVVLPPLHPLSHPSPLAHFRSGRDLVGSEGGVGLSDSFENIVKSDGEPVKEE
ncbi:hypothetical protein DY000_02036963 [Brassica cretica]|uniref:Uncharacterized protein n=1 Tax=Brassica cretica TaxID=69181 RepID=A0ABQ7BN94_BRACR|nr:hypothetical protein DY000_02036963 [Brassica cretica]